MTGDWSAATNGGTDRGFTGHEHLDDVGIVHMNGRLFDPRIGRFMQADPMVSDPFNTQAFDRYGYCYGDPTNCTDPTGYFNLRRFINNTLSRLDPLGYRTTRLSTKSAFGRTVATAAMGFASLFCYWGAPACFAGMQAAYVGIAQGANFKEAAHAGTVAGIQAALFYGVGELAPGFGQTGATTTSIALNTLGHAAVGCASAEVSGGKCGQGALSAGFSAAYGNYVGYSSNTVLATLESSFVGGVSSQLGGGRFAEGARSGAIGYLFNAVPHRSSDMFTDSGYGGADGPGAMCNSPTVACADQNARATAGYLARVDGPLQPSFGPDDLVLAAFAPVRISIGLASDFFKGAYYSEKVLIQAAAGEFHGFPQSVDGFAAAYGSTFTRAGRDGSNYTWLTIQGEYLGKKGTFE